MRPFLAVVVVAACLASRGVHSASGSDFGPLANVKEVSVDVSFGDSLGVAPQPGERLYGRDLARAGETRAILLASIRDHLHRGGVTINDASRPSIRIGIFGGKFPAAGDTSKNFFMVQGEECVSGHERCSQGRTVLGVADDSRLQEQLVNAAATVIEEFLARQAQWRQSTERRQ